MRETGVGIQNPLFFIGVVENNIDSRLEGRIQVRAFGIHGTVQQVATEDLPWATIISGAYDPDVPVPPLNSLMGISSSGTSPQSIDVQIANLFEKMVAAAIREATANLCFESNSPT